MSDGTIGGDAGPRLIGASIDPVGPVNVFNEKIAIADAINRAIATKDTYDAAHPPAPPPPALDMTPIGVPISAGRRITPDPKKYVLDTSVRDRVTRKNRFVRST